VRRHTCDPCRGLNSTHMDCMGKVAAQEDGKSACSAPQDYHLGRGGNPPEIPKFPLSDISLSPRASRPSGEAGGERALMSGNPATMGGRYLWTSSEYWGKRQHRGTPLRSLSLPLFLGTVILGGPLSVRRPGAPRIGQVWGSAGSEPPAEGGARVRPCPRPRPCPPCPPCSHCPRGPSSPRPLLVRFLRPICQEPAQAARR